MKYHAATILRVTLVILTSMFILLTASAFASQFTVLHTFLDKPTGDPDIALIIGPDGGFYGATGVGGVFEIKQTSTGWQYQVIHLFPDYGERSYGRLLFDSVGNLYGTTFSLVGNTCFAHHIDCGRVFKLSHTSNGWAETDLYRFKDRADGADPAGNLVLDSAGNLYGTTLFANGYGCGVVYELSPGTSGWKETVLHTFTCGSDGSQPEGLTPDTSGDFLGVAHSGGTANSNCPSGCGTVFKLTPGAGGWSLSVIYRFSGGSDGAYPNSPLVFDGQGNLFGTAGQGGLVQCGGGSCGTVFELSPNRSGWNFKDVYRFSGPDGMEPQGIVLDSAGNLFGVTGLGGKTSCDCGVLFKLVPGSGSWTETVLYKFNGTTDGANPNPVILDGAGHLFGTAFGGGHNHGTVFRFTP